MVNSPIIKLLLASWCLCFSMLLNLSFGFICLKVRAYCEADGKNFFADNSDQLLPRRNLFSDDRKMTKFKVDKLKTQVFSEMPSMEVNMEGNLTENHPPAGLITITHTQNQEVDEASFQLGKEALHVDSIDKIPMTAGDAILSIYRFNTDPVPAGLHLLPSIRVEVGGHLISSMPIAYEVKNEQKTAKPVKKAAPSPKRTARPLRRTGKQPAGIIFRLEVGTDGPRTLYPGQKTKLFYKIIYNRSVDLTESFLPFVHALPFKKVGDARVNDYQQGSTTVQEIVQEVEAYTPGKFSIGPSRIAGYAYQFDQFNKKVSIPTLLRAQAPALSIEVKNFPLESRPVSFNGSLGQIEAALKMATPQTRHIGDKIKLELTLSGVDNLSNLKLPDLFCQPGLSGFFETNSRLPPGNIDQSTKIYNLEMRVVSRFVRSIPPLEFSSFNPQSGAYVISKTNPIPIDVIPHPLLKSPSLQEGDLSLNAALWDSASWPLSPLEMRGRPVAPHSLFLPWFETFYIFLAIPLALIWLYAHCLLKRAFMRPSRPIKESERLWKLAFKRPFLTAKTVHDLEYAFWWKTWEQGILPLKQTLLEKLPQSGLWGEVRAFILILQSVRYHGNKMDQKEMNALAKKIWEKF